MIELGEVIDAPGMDDTITVVSAVRDFASDEAADLIANGGEIVLLEISVDPSTEEVGARGAG